MIYSGDLFCPRRDGHGREAAIFHGTGVGMERGEELEPPKVSVTFFPPITVVAPGITLTLTPRLLSTVVVSRGVHRTYPDFGSSPSFSKLGDVNRLVPYSLRFHLEDIS